jgi:hypothetical protein
VAVDIIRAVAWPLVASIGVVAAWWSGFLGELGRRSTRISVFQVSLELATVSQRELPGLEQLRDPVASSEVQSGSSSLMQQLLQPEDIDYVVIDLRDGHRWLASRLYLFAELLRRQRSLRCIVFVEHRDGVSRRLVGIADPLDVKWAMASRFPWLEFALNDSYTQSFAAFPPVSFSRSGGRLEPHIAESVASNFMSHPNIAWAENAPVPYPWSNVYATPGQVPSPWAPDRIPGFPVSPQKEWTVVHGQPAQYEHTRWLTGTYLTDVMSPQLLREDDWITVEPGMDEEKRVLDVLSRSGDFVATVNIDRRFRRLIERRLVLEEIARREVRHATRTRR